MRDKDLYATILGIRSPWSVTEVTLDTPAREVRVRVEMDAKADLQCPACAAPARRYDSRPRSWRHLDTCQYRTILVADVPRVECSEHGVLQAFVPWAEPGSRFTALFEALVIDWLKEASITAVADQLGLSWDEASGIQGRAVERGLRRRKRRLTPEIGVDETAFARRYEYVTLVNDLERGEVLHVADDRRQDSLESFFTQLTPEQLAAIEVVAMDMWGPYIQATQAHLPRASSKIAFDKFHVAQHLGDAVDKVRRRENRELLGSGDQSLVGTKYLWLLSTPSRSEARARRFEVLRRSTLKVAKAWRIKEVAMELWRRRPRREILADFRAWCTWARRFALEPIRQVANMIAAHIDGIVNAVATGVTNAKSEAINSRIQWIKRTARGFRNRDRFRNAIYFHLGGLDLYPGTAFSTHFATHTKA